LHQKLKNAEYMKKIYTYITMMMMAAVTMMSFSSCEQDDTYEAELLTNGDWQGYLGVYYSDRWRVSGTTYETVMHFTHNSAYATSGRGYEVDYDTRSPYRDYAYSTFKWFIVDGEITLIYDDDRWAPIYIYNYGLYSSSFRGYIDDGTGRNIQFDFQNVYFDDWNRYQRGSYGDFYSDYYYARATRSGVDSTAVEAPVPFERREFDEGGLSILSGSFAAPAQ